MMSGAYTKERELPFYMDFAPVLKSDGSVVPTLPGGEKLLGTGKQKTVSESHSYDRSAGHWSGGGPFFTSRVSVFADAGSVDKAVGESGRIYSGPVYCGFPTPTELGALKLPALSSTEYGDPEEDQLNSAGATAIARCSPVNPSAQLGQAIVETSRDGLPSMWGASTWRDRTLRVKQAGDEYLNHQYGWVPLVSDVKSASHVASNSGSIAQSYADREGHNTRRGYEFPSSQVQTDTVVNLDGRGGQFPGVTSNWWLGTENFVRTCSVSHEQRTWFSGSFTIPPPPQDDSWGKLISSGNRARELLGLELTPELLWEVTPWSWAVDWVTNVGDVLRNVSNIASAGQVMRYGYVMSETITKVTATISDGKFRHGSKESFRNAPTGSLSSGWETVTKRRAKANPFGFGLTWEGLSPFQLSIAAALGISRLL